MISEDTRRQLEGLRLSGRPLLICDVDEVVLHFTREFEDFLATRALWLATASFALNGNIRQRDGGAPVPNASVAQLIGDFFAERTLHMTPIDGAVDALTHIGELADVVLLTNLPHTAGEDRRRNLARHGLPFPVITNTGPKGPAVCHLAARAAGPSVFIDDSPGFIASARDHAPGVHLVHFLHDERFARHIAPLDYVSLRTGEWREARPHIVDLLNTGQDQPG
jgi:hypothetical protein